MSTMLRWSPTQQFHFHHDVNDLFDRVRRRHAWHCG